MGADNIHLFNLILKSYLWIFIVAAGIGCYSGYALSKLLLEMIFKINSGVNIASLTISFVCVLVVSGVTMGSRVWHAVHKKATDVLKSN